jgi:predicted lipase
MIVYRFEPNAVFLALNPQEALVTLSRKRDNLEPEMVVATENHSQDNTEEYARQIIDISNSVMEMQLAEQNKKTQASLENIIEETEKRQIKRAVERKDSGILVAASLRRLLSANQKQDTLKCGGVASVEDRAASISRDLQAANKLDKIAAEIERKKRSENFKQDIEKSYQQKKAKQRETQKADAAREAKEQFLQSDTDGNVKHAGQANGRKKKHKQVNVTV